MTLALLRNLGCVELRLLWNRKPIPIEGKREA